MEKFILKHSTKLVIAFLLSLVFLSLCPIAHAASGLPTYVSIGTTGSGGTINVSNNDKFAALIGITSVSTVSGTFTCVAATDLCTNGTVADLITGEPVQVSSTTTLPTNISGATTYYAIKVSDTTFKLASSLAFAQAGTAIDLTSAGTGTHTIGGVALAGASMKLQGSMDGTVWADLPIVATGDATKSANITATGYTYLYSEMPANYVRVYFTLTSGALNVAITPKVRGVSPW